VRSWSATVLFMTDAKAAHWFDRTGAIVEALQLDGRTTAYGQYDRHTHAMFGESSDVMQHQAMTVCGKRGGEIPARGAIDCPECIDALT
jgi:hypothetical protein